MDHTTPEVVIQPALASDINEVATLWCEAFPGERTVAERARMLERGGRYGGLDTVLVARRGDGALVGACKVYRMTQYIGGVAMPMMGLAAVAVDPHARRRGIGARLCVHAMEAARERGDVVSTLYPFRADYYQRLGWGLVGELHEYRFQTSALPDYVEARHVRVARGDADAEAISACYARVVAGSNGPIQRDPRIWSYRLAGEELGTRPLGPGSHRLTPSDAGGGEDDVVVYDRAGVRGYALLRGISRSAPGKSTLQVRELVAESDEAYRGLLGHIRGLGDRWPVARHAARPEERFGDRLGDPRRHGVRPSRSLFFPTATILRGPMLRILDMRRALALRRYFDAGGADAPRSATLELRIDDSQIEASHGSWLVRIDSGLATVHRLDGDPGGDPASLPAGGSDGAARIRVETDAHTLARIFAGELAPGQAAQGGAAVIAGDVALVDAAFATRDRFWLLDEF